MGNEEVKLKPCPFCGGVPYVEDGIVMCGDCDCKGPDCYFEDQAISRWNKWGLRWNKNHREKYMEIKFRGKRLDNGELVYGSLYQDDVQSIIMPPGTYGGVNGIDCHLVDPKTIGQFSQQFDCRWTEIYHGDILVDNETGDKFEVTVDPIDGSMATNLISTNVGPVGPLAPLSPQTNMTVINNVYERYAAP